MNKGREFANAAYPRRYEGHVGQEDQPRDPKVVVTPAGQVKVIEDRGPLVPFGNTWG